MLCRVHASYTDVHSLVYVTSSRLVSSELRVQCKNVACIMSQCMYVCKQPSLPYILHLFVYVVMSLRRLPVNVPKARKCWILSACTCIPTPIATSDGNTLHNKTNIYCVCVSEIINKETQAHQYSMWQISALHGAWFCGTNTLTYCTYVWRWVNMYIRHSLGDSGWKIHRTGT